MSEVFSPSEEEMLYDALIKVRRANAEMRKKKEDEHYARLD